MARRAVLLTPSLLLVALTGCTATPRLAPPTRPSAISTASVPASQPIQTLASAAQSQAADRTAKAASCAWHSWDTRKDRRPDDTMRRLATRYLCPQLRKAVAPLPDIQPYTDAAWTRWTAHGAWASVDTKMAGDEHPADSTTTAWRETFNTVTMHGRRGGTETVTRIDWIKLARTDSGWCIDDVTTRH